MNPELQKALLELTIVPDTAWQKNAACKNADTKTFFIGPGRSAKAALTFCTECRVRQECLDFAMDNDEEHGIWGGLNADQRRKLRRRRAADHKLAL